MSQNDILTFNMTKGERSGRLIRTESEKLKRMADRLQHNIDNIPSWWSGDSRNKFIKQMTELVTLTEKVSNIVSDMSNDMLDAVYVKTQHEEQLRQKLESL